MNRPQNLLSADRGEVNNFINSFDTVLCDCDGVIHIGSNKIEKSKEVINLLQGLGKKVHFVSNNCSLSLKDFKQTLKKFDLDVDEKDIVFPTIVIIDYLKKIGFKRTIFLIGLKKLKEEFEKAGFKTILQSLNEIEENAQTMSDNLIDDKNIGAVIVDIDINLTYLKLQKACVYLKRNDVLFMTGGSDCKIPFYNNITLIGPNYFHKALIDITGRQPIRFGKPDRVMNQYIESKYKLKPNRTLFIGDSFTDIEFSQNAGYKSLLVLTGNTKFGDLKELSNRSLFPDYYLERLGDLCQILNGTK
ncbi:uncharacterized protein [Onthophagus taurus]|uniref:uncharacterized protein n=1 Tax=Onthophagus taurus TaxID=166361 RepID=UPI0039BE7141